RHRVAVIQNISCPFFDDFELKKYRPSRRFFFRAFLTFGEKLLSAPSKTRRIRRRNLCTVLVTEKQIPQMPSEGQDMFCSTATL
ncbi:hypothetical protein, partial [Klebsiella pneumoniae]|uniref:hypothetical protein n=2 Tax=Klebsiella pneumoniae TaxID=573 RepID=UPI001C7097BC